jgi:RNA polymerase sigma-70 factor (ECF subfamily)
MTPEAHPDLELARRARDGDENAWREIYTGTRERLFALLSYHVGNRDEALDLLQETYAAAVRGIGAYEGRGSLESWLAGIALRRGRDWKRRLLGRFKNTVTLEGEPPGGEAPPQPDPEQGRRLRKALARLPERQRTAVLLHVWMGYSFREVGDALGVSEATARVHAFRGREALRAMLSEPSIAGEPAPARMQEQES